MAVPKVVTISNLKVLQRSWAKQTNQTVMAVGSWTLSILHSLVADRFLEKTKNTEHLPYLQFSPKGLTTKTDVFIVNFWPLPGFVSIILSVTFACFYNSCCPGILGNPCQIAPEFHSFWYPVCFYNYLATSSKNFRKQLSFAEQLPKTNKQTNNEDQWHKKVRS
jgi:hypothetical protein